MKTPCHLLAFTHRTFVIVGLLLIPLFSFNHSGSLLKPTNQQQVQSTRPGKDYAVFFYVTDYDDRRWPALPDTKTECEKIRDVLRDDYGFECEAVPNPSKEQIREKIRAYNSRTYGKDDQVFFFFSMHGHYDTEIDRGFLVARDGKSADLYGDSWYSYDDLGTDINRNPCKHILLALDACYSGAFGIRNKSGPDGPDFEKEPDCAQKISKALLFKSRLYFTSGSKESKTPGKSLFASRWLECLRTGGDGGIVGANDLHFFLGKIDKPKYDSGTFKGHDEGGNFVFIRKNACGSTPSSDRDGDGVRNDLDQCPDVYGTAANKGCPDNNAGNNTLADNDLDGVPNTDDACPDQYGTTKARGCPDQDDDGVPDRSDACPNQAGKANWQGCPDSDGDGLPDNTDQCPNQKGAVADKGCPPADRDADGVPDKVDKCPDKAGKANREGCPDQEEDKTDDGLILVRGGTFTMGCKSGRDTDCESDESPAHDVTLSDFYIGKYEVTQKLWKQVKGNNPSTASKDCDDCPVENVSWDDIQDFLKKLNAQNPGRQYRLPTEAEWEYAARGGAQSKGYTYSGSNDIGMVAWYNGNSGSKTQPVGKRKANEIGIYDMSGNVWEWCSDFKGTYVSVHQTNPTGPDSGFLLLLRGGCWGYNPQFCRTADRGYDMSTRSSYYLGFRLARSF